MKRQSLRAYFALGFVLVISLCLPERSTNCLRASCVGFSSPFAQIPGFLLHSQLAHSPISQDQFDALCLKNSVLENQVERAYSWLSQEEHLDLRLDEEKKHAYTQGKVIFREPATWSQYFWIDVGLDSRVIGIDSPVVAGSTLVGVVDYVGKKRSRVKLVTNAAVSPSVRAVRGGLQKKYLLEHLDPLIRGLDFQDGLVNGELMAQLKELQSKLEQSGETHFLAKGQVHGMSEPLWRAANPRLKGVGFHYSLSDEKGNARDLLSGKPLQGDGKAIELIRPGDLLVTTGFDGIFPEGLKVGIVSKVLPANRSDPTYSIEVDLALSRLHDLTFVQILSPQD